jgi:hypothetical protein
MCRKRGPGGRTAGQRYAFTDDFAEASENAVEPL